MTKLIIEAITGSAEATVGGRPLAPPGTKWPVCRQCGGNMQFLAQLPMQHAAPALPLHHDKMLLLFQCQADPGGCEDWDADNGGNAAILVDAKNRVPMPTPPGDTQLPGESHIDFRRYDDGACDEVTTDDAYLQALDEDDPKTIGKIGGQPIWLQNDETPQCGCGKRMVFVAQLEESGGGGINFGDVGVGYAFACESCAASAKFLWQCH